MIVVIVLTISISGFFMGMRQTVSEVQRPLSSYPDARISEEKPANTLNAFPAVNYADMKEGAFSPNTEWRSSLANLNTHKSSSEIINLIKTENELRDLRMERRAYDGAPPVVPHPVDQHTAASCLQCHAQATVIGDVVAPAISHPAYTSCTQCHVSREGLGSRWNTAAFDLHTGNQFSGYHQPTSGERAYPDSPPTIPHAVHMRQNCISCHGPQGTSPIRTSHPERESCMQCHVPGNRVEKANFSESPFPFNELMLNND